MRFIWDQAKSDANFVRRGFDFAFVVELFDGPVLVRLDTRHEYGEPRLVGIGAVAGLLFTVVYTDREVGGEGVRRIISARRSNRHERQAFTNAQEG